MLRNSFFKNPANLFIRAVQTKANAAPKISDAKASLMAHCVLFGTVGISWALYQETNKKVVVENDIVPASTPFN